MKTTITGGLGFVGSHVVAARLAQGDEVTTVDLKAALGQDAQHVEGDLRDPGVVAQSIPEGTEAIVHLAARTSVLGSIKDPQGTFEHNVLATHLILERARAIGVKHVVMASTNAVTGNVGTQVISEILPTRPLTPYGATKAAGEALLSSHASSYGFSGVALRFTNIYGTGMGEKDSVIPRLMRAALDGGSISVYGDGQQVRDYVYVTDVAEAINLALGLENSDVFTIGSGSSVSVLDLHAAVVAASGIDIPLEHVAAQAGEMPAVIVNIAKAQGIGFTPQFDLLAGLSETWSDFLAARG
jgi:UDP-glucose 4-epimerase